MTSSGARGEVKEVETMRTQAKVVGEGPGVLMEWIKEGSRRRNFEGDDRGGVGVAWD